MAYHEWNDNWPYWPMLYKAENFISAFVRKTSPCFLVSKEKYGTVRYEWVFVKGVGAHYKNNFFHNKIVGLLQSWGHISLHVGIIIACYKYKEVRNELLCDYMALLKEDSWKFYSIQKLFNYFD